MSIHPSGKLGLRNLYLKDLASKYGFELWGDDIPVHFIGNMTPLYYPPSRMLSYATNSQYLHQFQDSDIGAAIVPAQLKGEIGSPGPKQYLLTADHPQEMFYRIHMDAVKDGYWETVEDYRGEGVEIASTAVIHPHVQLHDGCRIMDQAVVLSNSIIGPGVVVGPQTTIGRDGFEIKIFQGHTRKIPHAGGVRIERDCDIGASVCIDRGLFGEFTCLGPETQVDNLIHIAHNVIVGQGAVLVACSEISGSCTIGDGVFLGASTTVLPQVAIGNYSYIGAGSVVTRSVEDYTLAYGSPAKPKNRICRCRTALSVENGRAVCPGCGKAYIDGVDIRL